MIRISVTLISAVNGRETELARMHINNLGTGTDKVGHYVGLAFRGRGKEMLNNLTVSKSARVMNWKRNDFHVWNLIRLMLTNMGYTKGTPLTDWSKK